MFLNRFIRNSGQVTQCIAIALLAAMTLLLTLAPSGAANRNKNKAARQNSSRVKTPAAPAVAPASCTLPGISLLTDATGDTGTGTAGTVPGTAAQDLTEILVAEPSTPDGVARTAFTMRLADLASLPASGIWRVFFAVPNAPPATGTTTYFVGAFNDPVAGLQYNYGRTGTTTTTLGAADGGSISMTNKTITVLIANSKVGNPGVGTLLTGIYGRTQTLIGTAGTGATPTHDLAPNTAPTSGTASYTLVGNAGCGSSTPTPTPTATVSPTATPSPSATPSDPHCGLPGIQVLNDPSGDQTGAPSANSQLDLQAAYVAEPFTTVLDNSITFTLKVANLSGTPQPNSTWQINMNVPDLTGTTRTIYFNMNTADTPGVVSFNYGWHDSAQNTDTSQCGATCPVSGSFNADGTITIKVNTTAPLPFSDLAGMPVFSVNLLGAGHSLTSMNGATSLLVGVLGNGLIASIDDMTAGTASYLTIGNGACQAGATPTPTATVSPTATPSPTVSPTATPVAGQPRFFAYLSPQGVGDSAGEPSIGSNWLTEQTFTNHNLNGSTNSIPNGGTATYFGGFLPSMLKVVFSDCSSPAGTTWTPKPLLSASTPRVFGDPILFTDHDTGRTFVAQLEGLTPAGSTIDITDNDGDSFLPSDGVIPSDVDHQTIGAGPYPSLIPSSVHPLYPNAVYYGSQSVAEARTLRSDNGGFLFSQASSPMYAINTCAGLHGHVKVAPDGTVYVPNKACGPTIPFHGGDLASAVFSTDGGITWNISSIPGATTNADRDPSVGIASDGTIYFGYQAMDNHARISVGTRSGNTITWTTPFDVGAALGIQNIAFPAVVAGDPNRAAYAFFGSTSPGTYDDPNFPGVWYLYVATTFDHGQTWFTQNVTPGDPIQRGGICGDGTCRNLLDFFDATIDKEGRVLVGYDDGCISASCINGGNNDFTSKAAIARQTGGKRMFAAFDPAEPNFPGAPAVTGGRNVAGDTVNLTWPVPDNSGSPISGYNIYRQTGGSGPYTFLANVTVPSYTNTGLTPGVPYCYHVTAINGIGEGPYCADVCPNVVIPPNPCVLPGVLVSNDFNPDGTPNDAGANTPPDGRVDIQQLYVAEPCTNGAPNKLVFTLNVKPSSLGSPPASSQWFIVWQALTPNDDFDRRYVGMKSDASGNLSYEYGKFGVPLDATNPNPNANVPVKLGDADSGSYNVATGEIRITLSNSKAENVAAGQALSKLNVRTYLARPDTGPKTQGTASDITGDSTYTLVGNNACCATNVPLLGVVSRKTHGSNGTYDVALPLTGNPGIECRTGGANGDYTVVFIFANPITAVGNASVSAGSISSRGPGADPHEYIVNLTGVANAQTITITLTGVSDTAGNTQASIAAPMGVLLGDTNADRETNSGDISQTKAQSGQVLSGDNFREDVNIDGDINSGDISVVKSKSGTALPP